MENGFLQKIPADIRLNIYAEVFKGALITIQVDYFLIGPAEDNKPLFKLYYSAECDLAFTCRFINAESAVTMWSNATWEVVGPVDQEAWLHCCHKAVANEEFSKHIVHLRNVAFPTPEEVIKWYLMPASSFLRGFPRLQTCGFFVPDFESEFSFKPAIKVDDKFYNMKRVRHDGGLARQLLPFINLATNEWSDNTPQGYLDALDIPGNCGVQMVMERDFEKFPVQCSIAGGGDFVARLPVVRSVVPKQSLPLFWIEDADIGKSRKLG